MRRRRGGPHNRARLALALAALLGLVVGVGLSCQTRRSQPLPTQPAPVVRIPAATPRAAPLPTPSPRPRATPTPAAETGPRVAIIFDDAGGSLEDVEEITGIGRPVTVAVLPGLAYSSEVARRAVAAGLEVLLHLPIEAMADNDRLGPGAVRVAMSDEEIKRTVLAGLASVPGAIGVNNHMGSRGTADPRVMRAVLEVVRERRLMFIDSRTTADTVAESLAVQMGIPSARRHVFLDNIDDEEAIRREVQRLISLARAHGEAIAIGHAQRLAPRVVAQMREEFDRQGVRIVPLSTLVR